MSDGHKEYLTFDWLVKILIGIVAFFLINILYSVQKMSEDVSKIKSSIEVMKLHYEDLDVRIKRLENQNPNL